MKRERSRFTKHYNGKEKKAGEEREEGGEEGSQEARKEEEIALFAPPLQM